MSRSNKGTFKDVCMFDKTADCNAPTACNLPVFFLPPQRPAPGKPHNQDDEGSSDEYSIK